MNDRTNLLHAADHRQYVGKSLHSPEIINDVYRGPTAIYTVSTSRGDIYMSVSRTNYRNDRNSVVIVDAAKFLELWRADTSGLHRDIAMQSVDEWPDDRKFKDAEEGFSHGRANPVPLADISCYTKRFQSQERRFWGLLPASREVKAVTIVAFTNGITRTIWLLSHECPAFPVRCDSVEAETLFAAAGIPGSRCITVDELLPADVARFGRGGGNVVCR